MCVAGDPSIRLRDIADAVGITERATLAIIGDLVDGGYLVRRRVGRRNEYEVVAHQPLRHPLEREHQVDELLDVLRPVVPGA